jgi:hypothetical protein
MHEANLATIEVEYSEEYLQFLEDLMRDRQDYYQSDSQY